MKVLLMASLNGGPSTEIGFCRDCSFYTEDEVQSGLKATRPTQRTEYRMTKRKAKVATEKKTWKKL